MKKKVSYIRTLVASFLEKFDESQGFPAFTNKPFLSRYLIYKVAEQKQNQKTQETKTIDRLRGRKQQ